MYRSSGSRAQSDKLKFEVHTLCRISRDHITLSCKLSTFDISVACHVLPVLLRCRVQLDLKNRLRDRLRYKYILKHVDPQAYTGPIDFDKIKMLEVAW